MLDQFIYCSQIVLQMLTLKIKDQQGTKLPFLLWAILLLLAELIIIYALNQQNSLHHIKVPSVEHTSSGQTVASSVQGVPNGVQSVPKQ